MGYRVIGRTEDIYCGYTPRKGLEGPFVFGNGWILYYDPRQGQYWDPRSDFYVDHDEMADIHSHALGILSR